jgi:hypothetical protein
MNEITIKGGWKKDIYDIAKSIIVECKYCHKDIDITIPQSFGVIREPKSNSETIFFMCKECFIELQKKVDEMIKEKRQGDVI